MFKRSRLLFTVLSLCFAMPVFAQKSPECKPVLDAMLKVVTTDHSASSKDSGNRTYEGITVGGKSYIKIHDKWTVSPISPQEMLKQEQENIQNAKVYTCKALPGETVDGIEAGVYSFHSETPDVGTGDGTIWLSKSTGLPLKTEEDITTEGDKRHLSIRYSYTNIHAPTVN